MVSTFMHMGTNVTYQEYIMLKQTTSFMEYPNLNELGWYALFADNDGGLLHN